MEIKELVFALEETIWFLQNSELSGWAPVSVEEIIQELESEIARIKNAQPKAAKRLGLLFAPTGPIQEISLDNGWGDEYLRIAEVVDQFTNK